MKKGTVRRRIFVSNTAMVLATLFLFLLVNLLVVKIYSEAIEKAFLDSAEQIVSAQELEELLKTCASHSRYFSDELDALFFENKQNKCLQTILAYGIIKTWRKICLISIIMNFHMVEDMCIPCSTIWYGVQNTGKRF